MSIEAACTLDRAGDPQGLEPAMAPGGGAATRTPQAVQGPQDRAIVRDPSAGSRELDPMGMVLAELSRDADRAVAGSVTKVRTRLSDMARTRRAMIAQIEHQAHSSQRASRLHRLAHKLGVLEKTFRILAEINGKVPTMIGVIVSAVMRVGEAACRIAISAVEEREAQAGANVEQEKMLFSDAQSTIESHDQGLRDDVDSADRLVEFAATMDNRVAEIIGRQARLSELAVGRQSW